MAPTHAHPAGMRINVVNNHQAKQVDCVCVYTHVCGFVCLNFLMFIYLFCLCWDLVEACGLLSCDVQTLSCSMWTS